MTCSNLTIKLNSSVLSLLDRKNHYDHKSVTQVLAQTLLQKTGRFLLDIIYPPRCVSCGTTNAWLCPSCAGQIAFITEPICERCGTVLPDPLKPSCRQCQHNPLQYIEAIRSAAYFENNPIRPAIHLLKYRNHKAVAATLGQILADTCQRYHLRADIIVPVPLHLSRLRERGYNQGELLARELGALLGLPVDAHTLQRARATQSQMKLGAAERRQNVVGAFSCGRNTLAGQRVLLIDDVCTTGSTLDACAEALKEAGVASVWGVTLAKAR